MSEVGEKMLVMHVVEGVTDVRMSTESEYCPRQPCSLVNRACWPAVTAVPAQSEAGLLLVIALSAATSLPLVATVRLADPGFSACLVHLLHQGLVMDKHQTTNRLLAPQGACLCAQNGSGSV